MKKDPVCNMEVKEDEAITTEYDGEKYYFCSEGCRDKFLKEREHKPPRCRYDLIIVGGGPAGLTAAVYAATLRIHAFLVTKDLGGQAVDSTKIENYMGYDFITGPELIQKFKYQVIHSHYIDHLMSEVEKIETENEGFKITASDLSEYLAGTLIIATGMTRRKLNVPGEERFQRKGIFYGNIQDLSFVEGTEVAVIGGGNSALQIVENLHTVAKNIYLVSHAKLTADPVVIDRVDKFENLTKYEEFKVIEFTGKKMLNNVTIRRKAGKTMTRLSVKGVFIAIGLRPNSVLVSNIVECNDRGEIKIGPDCSTSYPGIFAAGDVTDAFGNRIIIASGEGAKAAMAARKYILGRKRKSAD